MENWRKSMVVFLILVVSGFLYHFRYLNEFPSHIHAWAQSDRYALSLGFMENGLNFFKPQTYVLNRQFPDDWKTPSESGITSVDFPIHDYIPAVIMKISGTGSPTIFRVYILIYSFFGLFFLYKLSFLLTSDNTKSLIILLFASTSPVYVYYQSGFLPTIPSLSNTFIALFFYFRYLRENKNKDFTLSLLFLTLAALSRTTFIIPLFAMLCNEFLRFLRKETRLSDKIKSVIPALSVIALYTLYNSRLRNHYGSIFLNHFLPARNVNHAKEILKTVYENWFYDYFTKYHYILIILAVLSGVFFVLKKKVQFKRKLIYPVTFLIFYYIGCSIFAVFMLRQFAHHDYYFLDTFFIPVILTLVLVIIPAPAVKGKYFKLIGGTLTGILLIIMLIQPVYSQKSRRKTGFWDRTGAAIKNFQNASLLLDSTGVSKNSKMLVIDAAAPNIPFILMERKGFVVMTSSKENMQRALDWNYDYVVYQNEYFISDIYSEYPDVINHLQVIANNDKITVCTYSDCTVERTLFGFLGLDRKVPVFEKRINFENGPDSVWQNIETSAAHSGTRGYSGYLSADQTYGLTFKSKDLPEITEKPRTLLISSRFLQTDSKDCELVAAISEKGNNIYYKSYNVQKLIKENNSWNLVSLIYQLPQVRSKEYEFSFFLWNTGRKELYYDDVSLTLY